jgi:hypothetical protein
MSEFLFAYEQDKYSQCKQISKELKWENFTRQEILLK